MAKRDDSRSQRRLWPLLVGSILFGLVGALLAAAYLSNLEHSLLARLTPPPEQEVDVAVAAQDLPRGTVISPENFQKLSIPVRYVHSDAISPGDFAQYQGRAITVALGAGKPLLRSHLDEDFPIDFSDIVEKGRRALTVTVNEVNSVAGFIRPGNRIDLLVNIALNESGLSVASVAAGLSKVGLQNFGDVGALQAALRNLPEGLSPEAAAQAFLPKEVIIPVVQDVRVIATGREPYYETLDQLRQPQPRAEGRYSSLTLDVSAKQAAYITAALDKGDLLALLRNRGDRGLADFTSVSVQDLFGNAERMAREQAEQQRKVVTAAGANARGDLVDANGKVLASRDALAAAGFKVDANGNIVDKDGNVVDPKDLIVTADGRTMSRKQLEEAGLRVDAQGRIVDASGNVVDPRDVVVTKDGRVMSKTQLANLGLSVNANGEVVDATGRVVSAQDIVTTRDGRVFTREQLAQAGLSVDASGNIVDKDGNAVDTKDIVVAADGRAMTRQQMVAAGIQLDAQGRVVSAQASAQELAAAAARAGGGAPQVIDLIIGGASKDGVAKTTTLQPGAPTQ